MPFTPFGWTDETDPLGPAADPTHSRWNAAAAIDLETRVTDYADIKAQGVSVAEAPYSAIPDGSSDNRAGIQAAIAAVHAAGGGRVFLPWTSDPYLVTLTNCPGSTSVSVGLYLYSDVELWSNGATIKLVDNADPGSRTQWHVVGVDTPYTTGAAVKSGIKVVGNLTIDGNAAGQTLLTGKQGMGLFTGATESFTVAGVKVKNVYGTAASGAGESFHFEANNCKDGSYIDCEADGSGSANTATGFSTDNSFGITWSSCNAHDMGFGQGFTCWQSANLAWEGCRAWKNAAAAGFNAERSEGLRWSACHSGGKSPLIGNGDSENPFFSGGQVTLANTTGFKISGCTDAVVGADCSATYNTTNLDIHTNTGGSDPAKACSGVVAFGMFRHATGQNVYIENSSEGGGKLDQPGCMAFGPNLEGVPDAMLLHSKAGFLEYQDVSGGSGLRHAVQGLTADVDGPLYRWQNKDGNDLLKVDRARRTTTVGRVKGYRQVSSNTTIAATDHVLGVDTSGGAYTLTLPQFGTVGGQVTVVDGTEYLVCDYGNNAAVNNITIACAGSDTFVDASTSKTIWQNAGICQIIATNGKWKVIEIEPGFKHRSPYKLTTGEEVFSRLGASSTYTLTSGQLRLSFFTAETTETISQVAFSCSAAQSGTAPTLIRYGIYTEASNGDISLTKSTTNDTSLFGSGNARSTKSLSSNLSKVAGQRYAVGALVVTTGTAPTAFAAGCPTGEAVQLPRIAALLTGQSDLPSSVTKATLDGAASGNAPYAVLLP